MTQRRRATGRTTRSTAETAKGRLRDMADATAGKVKEVARDGRKSRGPGA
jgi:hypothetical protein